MSSNEKICVIGWGVMGRYAVRIFSPGYRMTVISARNVRQEVEAEDAILAVNQDRALKEADFVFLAVPVDIITQWTERINKFTLPNCVVIDCCTARVAAEKELKEIKRKRFGIPELIQGTVPVIGDPDERIAKYLKMWGCNFQPMTAKEYDRSNTSAGTAHFLGIALDLSLDQEERSYLARTKTGWLLMQLIENMKTNSPTTYRETQILNPNMSRVRKKLINMLRKTDEELDKGIFRFEAYPREKWRK